MCPTASVFINIVYKLHLSQLLRPFQGRAFHKRVCKILRFVGYLLQFNALTVAVLLIIAGK